YHITRNVNDVDDLAQEVFLKAYQSIASYRGGSLRAYFGKITRNLCYDALRRKRVRSGLTLVEWTPEAWVSQDLGPEETTVNRDLVAEVSAILDEMNAVDREIILLRHVHQFSYEEIAAVVGMRPGTVRTRIARARQRIIAEMERREQREPSQLG
ncbi:MAG: RNA polymerase sigma factor, partial [Alicyclobacillus sp.]|nr:RNA polymerase sigma factor [Alicyclobacillus sp.]